MSNSQDSYLKAIRHALKSALSLDFSSQTNKQSYVKNQINRNANEKVFITSNTNGVRISIAIKQRNYLSEIVGIEFPKFKTRMKNKCTIKEREPDPGYAIYFLITNIVEIRKQEIEDYVVNFIEDIDSYSVSEKPPISLYVKVNTYYEETKNNFRAYFEKLKMEAKQSLFRMLIEFIIVILLWSIFSVFTQPLEE